VGEGGGGGDGVRPRGEGLCRPARASAAPSPRGAGRTGAGTAAWPSLVVGGRERGGWVSRGNYYYLFRAFRCGVRNMKGRFFGFLALKLLVHFGFLGILLKKIAPIIICEFAEHLRFSSLCN
jgi:hypothetical protein